MATRFTRPISIPQGVTVEIEEGMISVKGPKGTLTRKLPPGMHLERTHTDLILRPKGLEKASRALAGTFRAHLHNMLRGVEVRFRKRLIIEGVGYRVRQEGATLVFELGFSHPVRFSIPDGLRVTIEKDGLLLESSDRELLGATAAKIRNLRLPDPYKGKGIRYEDEVLRLKPGKRAVSTA